ncbi:hypothetical protein L8106_30085 [Lyngbya sp. PCC 8106]|nr:hypothetical protein L8106_30085 [Lyngbya sp. PCC 8106]
MQLMAIALRAREASAPKLIFRLPDNLMTGVFAGSKRHTTKSIWGIRSSLNGEASALACQLQLMLSYLLIKKMNPN